VHRDLLLLDYAGFVSQVFMDLGTLLFRGRRTELDAPARDEILESQPGRFPEMLQVPEAELGEEAGRQ
jgi:hypothetical protein